MKKVELFNDHFQNFKVYGIPHAQLIIADPPHNLGKNAYGGLVKRSTVAKMNEDVTEIIKCALYDDAMWCY